MATQRIVLVTGANSGIGLATITALWNSSKTYHILAAGRSLEKIQQAISELQSTPSAGSSTIEALVIDVSSDNSIATAVAHLQTTHGRIDALVNNAGGNFEPQHDSGAITQREAWNRTLDLNTTSPLIMTTSFAGLLLQSSDPRLVVLTSGIASLIEEAEKPRTGEKPYPAGWPKAYAYRVSKAALNMMFLQWVRMFAADGVKCFSLSPGFIATKLAGPDLEALKAAGAADPNVAGEFVRDVLEGKRDGDAGKVLRRGGAIQPW